MNSSVLRLRQAFRTPPIHFLGSRPFTNHSIKGEEADFEAARQWFQSFTKSSIPRKLAKTTFSRSSGPGGQKTNKTSSKATTTWSWPALAPSLPSVVHRGLKSTRYYVQSSDSISIQCDTHRGQTENEEENHRRLHDEINQIYKRRVPGVTSTETKAKHEAFQRAANATRLKTKKQHSDKKQSRRGGNDN